MSGIFLLSLAAPLSSAMPQSLSQALLIAGGLGWAALHATWALRAAKHRRQPLGET